MSDVAAIKASLSVHSGNFKGAASVPHELLIRMDEMQKGISDLCDVIEELQGEVGKLMAERPKS